jgi:hypothetical protein
MLRRTTLIMALVAGALLAGLVAPARADQIDLPPISAKKAVFTTATYWFTPEATCTRSSGGSIFLNHPYEYKLTAQAVYRTVPGAPGFYRWTQFQYRLDRLGVAPLGGSSNVTFRLYEGGTLKFQDVSPDNVGPGYTQFIMPTSPPITSTTSSTWIEVEAIFDRPYSSDPRCTARAGRV